VGLRLPDFSVFRHRNFALYWGARVSITFAWQIQATALGWHVYNLARDGGSSVGDAAFLLGAIGLAQFLPLLFLSLIGGQAADRYDRRLILLACLCVKALVAIGLIVQSQHAGPHIIGGLIATAALSGAINAFQPAAAQSLMPMLIPREELPKAIALSSLAFTGASILGPSLAGALIAIGNAQGHNAQWAYGATLCFVTIAFMFIAAIKIAPHVKIAGANAIAMIKEGVAFVRGNQIVLGAISLDLIVVFLAGAQAMLPLFARDVLHVDEVGLGVLRAGQAMGAAAVALVLAAAPLRMRVGAWMFGATFAFGAATIVFGLSQLFWLTLAALIVCGAVDMISVYVRQSLIQLATPDAMRGRVSAVSFIFISASNELGDFEAGLMARLFGPALSVLIGGTAAIGASALWMRLFPQLARADTFEDDALVQARNSVTDAK
jgi:MFS family permease